MGLTTTDILIPVILSGGSGSRLWPVSREHHPKPFIRLPDGQSLLEKTYSRACHFSQASEIITITNKEYYLKSKAEYKKVKTKAAPPLTFLLEPCGRNTAPAIAFAALKALASYGENALLLILPADHLVENMASFAAHCNDAFAAAKTNLLVTLGVRPTYPETGYGYIEYGETYPDLMNCHRVRQFVEKPELQLAETYLQSSCHLWNSGMFCFTAGTILRELAEYAPALLAAVKQCWQLSYHDLDSSLIELATESFLMLHDISIDYAIMEKSTALATIACDFDWQDIGSWEAYKKLHHTDQQGNTILGEAVLIDSENNFIHSENRIVASIGINNLAIIDTPDALLVTHRDRSQDVKQIAHTLKNKAHKTYLNHRTVLRPWGSYTILEEGPCFKIKRIVVEAHASLSLQLHHHRSEHWVVVEGIAYVVNGEQEYTLKTNESTFVPQHTPHRLANLESTHLIIIEVQTGSYLEEDDIVRLEDSYGRVK